MPFLQLADCKDRIACALGGDAVFMFILQYIGTMVARPEWQARHAALMAISAIGEGLRRSHSADPQVATKRCANI